MKGMQSRITITCILVAGLLGCGRKEEPRAAVPVPVVNGVAIAAVSEEQIPEYAEIVGTVKARNSASIAARVAGTLSSVRVREGDRVTKGMHVATIDAAEPGAGAAGAAAAVELARRGVDEASARKTLAEATFERYERLYHDEAVTKQEYETKRMEKEVARQGLAQAEAQLLRARQEEISAGATAGYRHVVSPITGVVTVKSADAGMTVFPGTQLLTVEETRDFRLELSAPESLSGKVHQGTVVDVVIDQVPGIRNGKVVEVIPSVDPVTRTFPVKVAVSGEGLRSGMYGRAKVPLGSSKGVSVPAAGVIQRGALSYVWVVDGRNIAHLRLIKEGRKFSGRTEALAGLVPGDRVITSGAEKVVEGAQVQ